MLHTKSKFMQNTGWSPTEQVSTVSKSTFLSDVQENALSSKHQHLLLLTGLPGTQKVFLNTVMVELVFCPNQPLKLKPVVQNENSKPVPVLLRINAAKEGLK